MDGVVVTRGTEKEHVWTFAGSLSELGFGSFVCSLHQHACMGIVPELYVFPRAKPEGTNPIHLRNPWYR